MHSRRAQILMEPTEYEALEDIARTQGTSVAELFRTAVRERYLRRRRPTGASHLDRLVSLRLNLPAWDEIEGELLEAKDGGIP